MVRLKDDSMTFRSTDWIIEEPVYARILCILLFLVYWFIDQEVDYEYFHARWIYNMWYLEQLY